MKPDTITNDTAFPAMAMDILSNVLSRVDNPGELGTYLTEEIRDLTGARCVLLIQCLCTETVTEHRVVSVNPLRRREWAESPVLNRMYDFIRHMPAAQFWRGDEPSEFAGILRQEGFELSMAFPLNAGAFRVGAMLVLGLPDEEHITSVLGLLNNLSAIVALVLRNSFLFERQEQIIQQRAAELHAGEKKYRTLIECANDAVFIHEIKEDGMPGPFIEVNELACSRLGYSREELARLSPMELDDPRYRDRIELAMERLLKDGHAVFETAQMAKDGRSIPVEVSTRVLELKGKRLLFSIVRDITEHKRAEEAQQRENALLRCVIDSVSDLIFIKDRDSVYLRCNKASEKFVGFSESEQIGKTDFDFFDREKAEAIQQRDRQVLATGKSHRIEEWVTDRDGGRILFDTLKAPYYGPNGEVMGLVGISRDITDRKRAEEERLAHLRFLESMDRVNRAIQGTTDLEQMMCDVLDVVLSIFDCDRAFLLYPCDPGAAAWHSPIERSRPEYPGILELGLVMPMDEEVAETLRILLNSGGPVKFGPGTGHPLPTDVSERFGFKSFMSMALYPRVGKPWQFGIHQCSYPRVWTPEEERLLQEIGRRLEDALTSLLSYREMRDSKGKLEEAQRIAHTGYWDRDIAGDRITLAGETCRIFGISRDESVLNLEQWHVRWLMLIHPEDRQRAERAYVEAMHGGPRYNVEYRIVQPGGDVRYVHSEANVTRDKSGHPIRMLGMMQDITGRKLAEAEAERLKNYLANIIDSMPSILVGMNRGEIVTQWNRKAENTTGISATEAVGRHIAELLPDFSPWIKGMLGEIDQQRSASIEKLLIEVKGERRFYDLMLYPLIANGVEGAVLRIEDVTEQARVQELMIQTEKMLSVGGMAAGMAHEINNPLGIILQAVQNIERRVSPGLPANRKAAEELAIGLEGINAYFKKRQIPEFIGSIREASLRASRIIANMLQFSRRAGSTMLPASPAGIIEQALELARSDYELKKKFDFRSIEIIRDYAPDVPEVPMVAVEMEQVMLNLLKNAAHAMLMNLPDRKPMLKLRLRREEKYVLIEVEDNGPGMGEDVRRRVFEPFFTTKEPGMGTGLGLSVSYMIVTQNHKGMMEVESKPGRGACFRVRLPLSRESILE